MMINKKIGFVMLFLIGIILFSGFAFAYVGSSYQYTSPGAGSFGYQHLGGINLAPSAYWDREQCEAGQDFVLQIAPFGCEPTIVRSDLLEEQNVPVFCQLSATKINPLIEVEAIDYMSFKREPNPYVNKIGYHPAQAAIKSDYRTLLNSPIMENVGYVIVDLRKQPNESTMPDFVEGNVTARIRYNIRDAFEIGDATFYLPVMDEENWDQNYRQYGFWNGRGYLRVEGLDQDRATISVYSDQNRIISTTNLRLDNPLSQKIYLPGFYCLAGMQLRLNSLSDPDTRARFNINGEIVQVGEGERFLNNKCRVEEIKKYGYNEIIEVRCDTDEKIGEKLPDFVKSPEVMLKTPDGSINVGLGDVVYADGDKQIFLSYIGKDNQGEEYILLHASPKVSDPSEFLNSGRPSASNKLAKYVYERFAQGVAPRDLFVASYKYFTSAGTSMISGETVSLPIYKDSEKEVMFLADVSEFASITGLLKELLTEKKLLTEDYIIEFKGFVSPINTEITNKTLEEYYENTVRDYRTVVEDFSYIKKNDGLEKTFAEDSLYNLIKLADYLSQKEDVKIFCEEFKEKYSDSDKDIGNCEDEVELADKGSAGYSVSINNQVKRISLEGIYEPSFEEYGAFVDITGTNKEGIDGTHHLTKDRRIYLSEGEYIDLKDVKEDYIKIDINLDESSEESDKSKLKLSEDKKINLGKSRSFNSKGEIYTISVNKINLQKQAKVSVHVLIDRAETEAEFNFKIPIEKRAIQLSPEKTEERIKDVKKLSGSLGKISDGLGKTVTTMKAACVGYGSYLTAKNLVSNWGGKAIARKEVMRSPGGWTEICKLAKEKGSFKSLDSCFLNNSAQIEADVNKVAEIMDKQKEITDKNVDEILDKIRNNLEGEDGKNGSVLWNAFEKNEKGDRVISLGQAKDIERYQEIISDSKSSATLIAMAKKNLNLILSDVKENSEKFSKILNFANKYNNVNDNQVNVFSSDEKVVNMKVTEVKLSDIKSQFGNFESVFKGLEESLPAELIQDSTTGKEYLVLLDGGYIVTHTFEISLDKTLSQYKTFVKDSKGEIIKDSEGKDLESVNPFNFVFKKYDKEFYKNKIINPQVRYYEQGELKGYPAVVPIDIKNGWYVKMPQSSLDTRNIRSYDSNGMVNKFYLCNVMEDGLIGDEASDGCSLYSDVISRKNIAAFNGLNVDETKTLIEDAVKIVDTVSRIKKRSFGTKINIGFGGSRQEISIGDPMTLLPELQCQDIMSPADCNKLFNVCDPVICPSSRCNLGGEYYVDDVVRSGIAGSLALCLPNYKEGIVVPVCLSGLHAGVDSWISVLNSYESCLQDSLETGQTVGVCDEMNSIYACEFLYRQVVPIAKVGVPKLLSSIFGGGNKGGGEYLKIDSAFKSADESFDYMIKYYGENAYKAFKARNTQEVGTDVVCKGWASLRYPSGGNFFDRLFAPDSPTQFSAWFSEISFTDATIPPISQYNVFYHIFAGQDQGAYYNVYLQSPSGGSFYQSNPTITVATGYIERGGFATEKRDFTAPSGYQQLCVNVNGQAECGFKQVSTSFGVEYIREQYLKEQVEQEATSEEECVSGSFSLYGLLTSPNIQEGLDEAISPELYNYDIVRTCATDRPGEGIEITNEETGRAKWEPMGYCDKDKGVICWLDTESVERNIKIQGLQDDALGEASGKYIEEARKQKLIIEDITEALKEIEKLKGLEKIAKITEIYRKVIYDRHKGELLFLRGLTYDALAKGLYDKLKKEAADKKAEEIKDQGPEGPVTYEVEEKIFEFDDGTRKDDINYIYKSGSWWWDYVGGLSVEIEIRESLTTSPSKWEKGLDDESKLFIPKFIDLDYEEGVRLLIDRTIATEGSTLIGEDVEFYFSRSNSEFKIEKEDVDKFFIQYFKGTTWRWAPKGFYEDWELIEKATPNVLEQKNINLLKAIEGKDFYEGALTIFDFEERDIIEMVDPSCISYLLLATKYSLEQGVPPHLVLAVMMQESNCNYYLISPSKAYGLMQITEKSFNEHCKGKLDSEEPDSFGRLNDKEYREYNIECGVQILKDKYDEYGEGIYKSWSYNNNADFRNLVDSCVEKYSKYEDYRGWRAALRGYNGWGCGSGANVDYVEEVWKRYNEFLGTVEDYEEAKVIDKPSYKIWEAAEQMVREGWESEREGGQSDYVCARFVTEVLINAGISGFEINEDGTCDTDSVNGLLEKLSAREDFEELRTVNNFEKGDIIAWEWSSGQRHMTVFNKYDYQNINHLFVFGESGENDPAEEQDYILEEDGRIVEAYRYVSKISGAGGGEGTPIIIDEDFGFDYISPIFEFKDGAFSSNLYYKYSGTGWKWSSNEDNWYDANLELPDFYKDNLKEENKNFIEQLKSKRTYEEGIKALIERTLVKEGFFKPKLSTKRVDFKEGVFTIEQEDYGFVDSTTTSTDVDFRYSRVWEWSFYEKNWVAVPDIFVKEGSLKGNNPTSNKVIIIRSLQDKDFVEGAMIIFDFDSP